MDRLDRINHKRELKGVSWAELAEELPVSGNALRQAFSRKSVKDSYLDIIERKLNINKLTQTTQLEETAPVYDVNQDVCRKFAHVTNEELIHILVAKFDDLMKYPTLKLLIERESLKKALEIVSNKISSN